MARIWVSTHALRRYVERVCGFVIDLDDDRLAVAAMRALGFNLLRVEQEILATVGVAPLIGVGSLRKGHLRFLFRGGGVVTVMDVEEAGGWNAARQVRRADLLAFVH